MLYQELSTSTPENHLAVCELIGVNNTKLYQQTLKMLIEFKAPDTTPRAILDRLELIPYYKEKKAGSATKVAKNELNAVLCSPQMGALVRNYLLAPKNAKNTCKVRFVMKGAKVWCMIGSPAFSKKVETLDVPKGDEIPSFLQLTDEVTEEEATQVIFEDKVHPTKEKPSADTVAKRRNTGKRASKKKAIEVQAV